MTEIFNNFLAMPWYVQAAVLYLSLWAFKMFITIRELKVIASYRMAKGLLEVPDNVKPETFMKIVVFMYTLGAGAALVVLLVPTLWREGLNFFKAYDPEQIIQFALSKK